MPATATPSAPQIAECTTKQLGLSLATSGGAAGTHFESLVATNVGATPCVISGYPGVSLVDTNGNQLGAPAERNTAIGQQAIVLDPHDSAHAEIGLPNHGLFEPGACGGPSAAMRVYPPDETEPVDLAFEDWACPGFSVRVFEPGAFPAGRSS